MKRVRKADRRRVNSRDGTHPKETNDVLIAHDVLDRPVLLLQPPPAGTESTKPRQHPHPYPVLR